MKRNLVVDDSPTKENNRISEYDNLDMADCHVAHKHSELEKKVESPTGKKLDPSQQHSKKENFFYRLTHQTHFTNLKKKKKTLYKANSEPFLNSQFFDPTLCQEEKDSIESLDCELELEKTGKDK